MKTSNITISLHVHKVTAKICWLFVSVIQVLHGHSHNQAKSKKQGQTRKWHIVFEKQYFQEKKTTSILQQEEVISTN